MRPFRPKPSWVVVIAGVSLILLLTFSPVFAQKLGKVDVLKELRAIHGLLDEVARDYDAGNPSKAREKAVSAYLDHFELVEIPLRAIQPDFTLEMEYRFAELRSKIRSDAPPREVTRVVGKIRDGLSEVEKQFTTPGALAPSLAFIASFGIIFREGVEAILLLATIVAYLYSSRNQRLLRPVYWGTGLAFLATAITWFVARFLVSIAPVGREVLEAIVTFLAVAVLFYMSFWLTRRLEQKRWLEFIKARAWAAASAGNVMAMVGLSFAIVYREGFETVLFYQALLFATEKIQSWVIYGLLTGIAVLVVLAVGVFAFGLRLPARLFLGTAMVVVMTFSVAFLGNAIRELQEAAVIPITSLIGVVPRLPAFLAELTGIHPTLESLGAQIFLALVYLSGTFIILGRVPWRKAKVAPQKEPSLEGEKQ